MKIGIIGLGVVGRAMRDLFENHAELVEYDIAVHESYPTKELASCDLAVICVGTPMRQDGACDTSQVLAAVRKVPVERVLIKSTVAPGTTDTLAETTGKQICFSPEYIRETKYFHSFWAGGVAATPYVILGGHPAARRAMIDDLCPILGPEKTYFQCTAVEAEIIKYMENSYLATKVTFVNEFYEICESLGADWHLVREGWLLDPRVDRSHTLVFPDNRGFAGNCLPKDVNAIVRAAMEAGYFPALLKEVLDSNQRLGGQSGSMPD